MMLPFANIVEGMPDILGFTSPRSHPIQKCYTLVLWEGPTKVEAVYQISSFTAFGVVVKDMSNFSGVKWPWSHSLSEVIIQSCVKGQYEAVSVNVLLTLHLQRISRYKGQNVVGSWQWHYKVTWHHWWCDNSTRTMRFPRGVPLTATCYLEPFLRY